MSGQFPSSPNLQRIKNLARQLHKHWLAGDPAAVQELRLLHPSFEHLPVEQLEKKMCLHNAQLALARKCRCYNWQELCARVALLKNADLSALTPEQISALLAAPGSAVSANREKIAAIQAEKLARYEQGRPFRENGTLYVSQKRGLTLEEALNDTAKIHDMPPVGTTYTGTGGIEWKVVDYGHFVAPPTMARYPDDCDYLPIVMPLKVSPRLKKLFYEVDHCTSKRVVLLDTMPSVHPFGLGKNIHCANMNADPEEVRVFLDVQNAHETLIAHELMHLWMWFVEGNVGERVLKDRSDKALLNQLDFIQSFVLDVRVNDLIEKRGFDMSPIVNDQIKGLEALRDLMATGFVPPTRREPLMYAIQIAGAIVERKRLSPQMQQKLSAMLEFFEAATLEIYCTAIQLVEIVSRRPLDSREALREALDACILLGFQFTGVDLDLERDFEAASSPECMQDKFPNELTKYKVPLKLEIWKTMSRLGIEGYGQVHVNTSPSGMAVLTFEPEDGDLVGPIQVNYRMAPPEWIIEHERERVRREQKQPAARRAPIDPNAPYRHIPMMERPRIKGMIPDDYGRLPCDNGYNTSYPPGQYPFSQMQPMNSVGRIHAGCASIHSESHGQFDSPVDQFGRPRGHTGYMMPFPTEHPSQQSLIPSPQNPVPSCPPPVFPWLDTSRNYMAGLTRSVAEARLAQQIGMNSTNLYIYVNNNPVMFRDPSGLGPDNGIPIIPCPPSVALARRNLCNILQSAGEAGMATTGCLTHNGASSKQAKCLLDWCGPNGGNIYCVADKSPVCNENGKTPCAFSYGPGGEQNPGYHVYLCLPRQQSPICAYGGPGKPCSSALRDSILHEMIGNCGSQHTGGDAHGYPDVCENRAECLCGKLGI